MSGPKIKEYLDEHGIKYSFIAKKIGMPMNLFSPLLNGKRKMSPEEYRRICEAIGVDVDYFSER